MRYLSFDLEATGLMDKDLIIEIAFVPIDAATRTIEKECAFHRYVKCPTFEELKPNLNEWVIKNNKTLIETANQKGLTISELKAELSHYLTSPPIQSYFASNPDKKIILFGKSVNALDFPLLNRDLGREYLQQYFSHRTLDVTTSTMTLIDNGKLPADCMSGSKLMAYFKLGDVAHNAVDDAVNTAILYFNLLTLF